MSRFLRNADYYRFIKQTHFEQLTEGNDQLLVDSEDDARDEIVSYLTNEYEVEEAFEVGKEARDFVLQKESFIGEKVWVGEKLYILGGYLNPSRKPLYETYWQELVAEPFDATNDSYVIGDLVEFDDALYTLRYEGYVPGINGSAPDENFWENLSDKVYSQDDSYEPGDYVKYKGIWFEALIESGDIINDVVQPFFNPWVNQNLVDFTTIASPEEGDVAIDTNGNILVEFVSGEWVPKQFFEFSDNEDYKTTDYVKFNDEFYLSKVDIVAETGLGFPPDLTGFWVSLVIDTWDVGFDYSTSPVGLIVNFNGTFYELYNPVGVPVGVAPNNAPGNWRVIEINEYDPALFYEAGAVVSQDGQFYELPPHAVPFVNASTFDRNKVEFTQMEDPRNKILKTCMAHLSLYTLHMRLSPDNVPMFRVEAHKKTLYDLKCYSKLSKDPSIPRKLDENGNIKSDWVIGVTDNGSDTEEWYY